MCDVDRSNVRLEAADEHVYARVRWAGGHHDSETPTSSPPAEVNEPSQDVDPVSAFPMTYACMLQMCVEVMNNSGRSVRIFT